MAETVKLFLLVKKYLKIDIRKFSFKSGSILSLLIREVVISILSHYGDRLNIVMKRLRNLKIYRKIFVRFEL